MITLYYICLYYCWILDLKLAAKISNNKIFQYCIRMRCATCLFRFVVSTKNVFFALFLAYRKSKIEFKWSAETKEEKRFIYAKYDENEEICDFTYALHTYFVPALFPFNQILCILIPLSYRMYKTIKKCICALSTLHWKSHIAPNKTIRGIGVENRSFAPHPFVRSTKNMMQATK